MCSCGSAFFFSFAIDRLFQYNNFMTWLNIYIFCVHGFADSHFTKCSTVYAFPLAFFLKNTATTANHSKEKKSVLQQQQNRINELMKEMCVFFNRAGHCLHRLAIAFRLTPLRFVCAFYSFIIHSLIQSIQRHFVLIRTILDCNYLCQSKW